MRFFGNAFLTALLQQLRSWKTWVFVLLLPALLWGLLRAMPARESSAPVQVGVSLPAEGGEDFWDLLEARSGVVVTFLPADEDTIAAKVASGQWDCGLLLPEDFAGRLEAGDTRRLITLCIGEGSTVYPVVRETAAACLAELLAPGIARSYLLESGIADGGTIEDMEPRLAQILPEASRVAITLRTPDGRPLDAPALSSGAVAGLLHGMAAIVLLIWALFAAMDMGRWLDTPAARRMRPLRGATALLLPRLLAAALPVCCSAALALRLLPDGEGGLWPLLAYLAALGGLSLLSARARPVWTSFPVLAPILPAVCLVTSPILLDLGALFPALGAVSRWMPVTLYLRACEGAETGAILLLALGAGAALLSLCLDRVVRR